MPLKSAKPHVNDAPWVTAEFKNLIKLLQRANAHGDQDRFRHLRNLVNRERKVLRSRYYTSRVLNLKNIKLNQWWNEVKKTSRPADICSQLRINDIHGKSDVHVDITELINTALLEPMQAYQLLHNLLPIDENSVVLKLHEHFVYSALLTLNL